jgi:hypothetical protein
MIAYYISVRFKPKQKRRSLTTTSNPQISPVAKIRALHDRLLKAEALVASGKVHPVYGMADHYIVEGKDAKYLVNSNCVCPDATNRPELKGLCKHKLAATNYAEQEAIAETPKVSKVVNKASIDNIGTTPDSDRSLEDQLADLYPKAGPTTSPR